MSATVLNSAVHKAVRPNDPRSAAKAGKQGKSMITNQVGTSENARFGLKYQDSSRFRVLVVDDNDDVRQLLQLAMVHMGYDVMAAGDGQEAYDLFLKHGADLVVTDLQMPVLDGYGLIERLEQISPHTPIVIVTGQAPDNEGVIVSAGVMAVLYKPFPIRQLQQIARAALLGRYAAVQS
jgi:CheY-like chemotaxis protein